MAYGYGKGLEQLIELTNDAYKSRGFAYIEKRHRKSKTFRKKGKDIVTGKAVVDYTGHEIIHKKGDKPHYIPIAFDAKECRDENKFPLRNIKEHQYQYLADRHKHLPCSKNFIIIDMVQHGKIFKLGFEELYKRWKGWKLSTGVPYDNDNGSYASISWEWMRENLEPIKSAKGFYLDYLGRG